MTHLAVSEAGENGRCGGSLATSLLLVSLVVHTNADDLAGVGEDRQEAQLAFGARGGVTELVADVTKDTLHDGVLHVCGKVRTGGAEVVGGAVFDDAPGGCAVSSEEAGVEHECLSSDALNNILFRKGILITWQTQEVQ